jgi:putative copper export protein
MVVDILSVALKTVALIATLQATGGTLFLAVFRSQISCTMAPVTRWVRWTAWTGIVGFLVHTWFEAARMAGELSGLLDPALLHLLVRSPTTVVLGVRVLGLSLILVATSRRGHMQATAGALGVVLLSTAFSLAGHSAVHPERALLAPMLMLHVLVVAFWFGALLPLYIVSRREESAVSARIVERFSRIAVFTVPLVMAAGLLMLWRLLPGSDAIWSPYGLLVLGKTGGFSLLMLLAALNKWRLGPRMESDADAQRAFRHSVLAEFVLLSIIVAMTALMTAFFSPAE